MLRFLARRAGAGDAPPSVREIASSVGLKSSQTVHHHLRKLEAEGYLRRESGARMVRLTEKGWGAAGRIGMLGRIAAGRGLEAVAQDEAYSLAAEMLASRSGKQRYLLRVVGRSMVGARIEDGDLLVVEEDEDPADGSVVVALIGDEEVTVKRIYREGEYVRLRPENGDHAEMLVPAEEARVQGRVVYVLHPPGRRGTG